MTSYTCFEELEASVPMSQLRPSVAFSRCAAHLPHDVDDLHGDELVQSMEKALSIHSKARVVLQCWVLLIMRRRVDARHEKDALYDRLQPTTVGPQEKIRYRRGAMLLCHLLIERDVAEADSLLDRYLVDFYFPWSSAINERDDTFYLQADVVHWVRQAFDHLTQNGSKMTAVRWLELSRSSSSPVQPVSVPLVTCERDTPSTSVSSEEELTPPAQHTRSKNSNSRLPAKPPSSTAQYEALPSTRRKKRRRSGVSSDRRELETLKEAIELWAKRLRRQLLQAARTDDKEQIRQVADELQAPPLLGHARDNASEQSENERDDDDEGDRGEDSYDGQRWRLGPRVDHHSTSADSDDSSSSSNATLEQKECTVCEADPKRTEQVWNASCGHGFCGDCMLAWLSQRERRCMYCRAKIVQVVGESGKVFQHYDWSKWWKDRGQVLVSV